MKDNVELLCSEAGVKTMDNLGQGCPASKWLGGPHTPPATSRGCTTRGNTSRVRAHPHYCCTPGPPAAAPFALCTQAP